jgi:hypothetical protein
LSTNGSNIQLFYQKQSHFVLSICFNMRLYVAGKLTGGVYF